MTRKLMLPLLASAGLLAVGAPAANASLGSKVGQLSGKVAGLTKAVSGLEDQDKGQNAAIDRVNNRVDTVVKNLAPVLSALPTVTTALTALADPTTGLRALNLARPVGGAFTLADEANRPSHTGIEPQATTPGFVRAQLITRSPLPTYYIDFGRDVSQRLGYVSSATPYSYVEGTLTNCGSAQSARDFCESRLAGTGFSASNNSAILTVNSGVPASGSGSTGSTINVGEFSG